MTSEKAIKIIRKMLAYTDLSVRANLTADMVDACHLAIKALEQEPILDEIRAEIEMEKLEDSPNFCIKAYNNAVERVLQIIDKYKADSNS